MLIKKLTTTLAVMSLAFSAYADGQSAQITTVPSPAVTTKALEVTIKTGDLGSEVYCYSWCGDINGESLSPWSWNDVNTAKFKMTGNGGTYSLRIDNIQEFYGLNDSQLAGLTKLGFIAKNIWGGQTEDLFINVEQGRRDVYGGGEGTASSPYILTTPAHLAEFSTTSADWGNDVYVKLGGNINGSVLTSPIGSQSQPYQGHFDGAGFTINEVLISSANLGSPAGLFGVIKGGEVKSLGVINATINGMNNAGVLAGTLESGRIERCFATGAVIGNSICVGGLVGENIGGTISDCYAGVNVENGDDYATGGLVGKNRGTIKNVYATGDILGKDYVGGIAGANYGTIRNSIALNLGVRGEHEYTARFGGNGNIENQSASNHSWEGMEKDADWSAHGDHASARPASDFIDFNNFLSLTAWDFENVWEWNGNNGKPYPSLRNIQNQKNVVPESFFLQSGIEEIIEAEGVSIAAGPNPFTGFISVTSSDELLSVAVYDLGGSYVSSVSPRTAEVSIDMSAAVPGVYVVSAVTVNGAKSTFKLIKK